MLLRFSSSSHLTGRRPELDPLQFSHSHRAIPPPPTGISKYCDVNRAPQSLQVPLHSIPALPLSGGQISPPILRLLTNFLLASSRFNAVHSLASKKIDFRAPRGEKANRFARFLLHCLRRLTAQVHCLSHLCSCVLSTCSQPFFVLLTLSWAAPPRNQTSTFSSRVAQPKPKLKTATSHQTSRTTSVCPA